MPRTALPLGSVTASSFPPLDADEEASNTFRSASLAAAWSTSHGRKSSVVKSRTKPSASRLTKPTNPRIIALRTRGDTSTTMPKSRYTKTPSGLTNRLPGCGSECMNPVVRSWCRLHRTPLSRRCPGVNPAFITASASDSREPSIHSITSTDDVLSSDRTAGARTIPSSPTPDPPPTA